MTNIPSELKTVYPFKSNYQPVVDKNGHSHNIHFVAEGDPTEIPVIMVHGNPTWSFFYRNLIKDLSKTRRVISIDHTGCGLSDKPQDFSYSLEEHIEILNQVFEKQVLPHLKEDVGFELIVHDWGGAIGMGLARKWKDLVRKVVIMNTAAFTDANIPKRISICKLPYLGEKLVRYFNAFAWPATFMAVERPMKNIIKKGYLLPYNNYKNRIATAKFVKDIPMSKDHLSWNTLKSIEDDLKNIPGEKLILWGKKDFCFTPHFYERWCKIYPQAQKEMLETAGHYLLEDEPEKTSRIIQEFLQ